MKTIQIEYFAILRERAGVAAEAVSTHATTPSDIYAELQTRYEFPEQATMKVAVNDEFSAWDVALNDGDRLVFIPPVAGG